MRCNTCKFALRDYEEYYGTNRREYFVAGCEKDMNGVKCEEYEESEDNEDIPMEYFESGGI